MFGNTYAPNVGIIFFDTYHATSSSSLAHISRPSIHQPTILLSALINQPALENVIENTQYNLHKQEKRKNAFLALIAIFLVLYYEGILGNLL